MADPLSYRPAPGSIPEQPGVYRFRDATDRVIYVGKARSLRSRLSSYFADPATLHPRTQAMVFAAQDLDWTVVRTEVEALQLEFEWIKQFDPRFNVKYRDDKSYPYLAVTMGQEYPRAFVMRGTRRSDTRYFGPYTHAWAIRETLDLLLRVFPVRTCTAGVFRRAQQTGRACLLGDIGKCSAPCVGRVSRTEHRSLADGLCAFLASPGTQLQRTLAAQMHEASAALDFERAARLRDDVAAVSKVIERSTVVLPEVVDADVFGVASDELEVAVQVFYVRAGRVRGQRGWVAERAAESDAELVTQLLGQIYSDRSADPPAREVLVPALPTDRAALGRWLAGRRGHPVDLRIPQRGTKAQLAQTVTRNAEQALLRHKMARAGDLTTRSAALEELRVTLGLTHAPLRIECFDISHLQGSQMVGSLVVFEDGLPKKSEYRHYLVQQANDDTAGMREVLTRRLNRLVRLQSLPPDPTRPRSYPPNLLLVDGGAAQVAAARAAGDELGCSQLAVAGLAKRLEEVWLPESEFPVILARGGAGLFLLQRIRDEAHRFAITAHRKRRSKAMTASILDELPGVGPAKSRALLSHFGSVAEVRAATPYELTQVQGVGEALARIIKAGLSDIPADIPAGQVWNATTGEMLGDDGREEPSAPAGQMLNRQLKEPR